MFKNFLEFKEYCQSINNHLLEVVGTTIVEFYEYPEYNWCQVAFMTDHFGGIYAIFHYNMITGEITYNYGHPTAIKMVNKNMIEDQVRLQLYYMLEHRDFDALSDFINSQY